jgi:hypothetical protein
MVFGGSKMLKRPKKGIFSLAEYAERLLGKAKFYLVFPSAESLKRDRSVLAGLGFVGIP